jgi:hypothetical protein
MKDLSAFIVSYSLAFHQKAAIPIICNLVSRPLADMRCSHMRFGTEALYVDSHWFPQSTYNNVGPGMDYGPTICLPVDR